MSKLQRRTVPLDVVDSVRAIYERGQAVEALRAAEQFAPLREWAGVEGAVLAARIATCVGAPRLASRLAARARRTSS